MGSAPMVPVPEGPFLRGSTDKIGLADEHPQRLIHLSAFTIDPLPVTFGDFAAFIESGGYSREELWSPEGWSFVRSSGA